MKIYRLGIILIISVFVLPAASAFADNAVPVTSTPNESNSSSSGHLSTITFTVHHRNNPITSELQKLELVVCESRQSALNTIMSRMTARMENQFNFFNAVTDNLETFYSTAKLSADGYAQVESLLNGDQASSANELSAMESSDYLDCVGTNALGLVTTFKSDSQKEIAALQIYKADLINLATMMRTASGNTGAAKS
jgi:hypothetical protein